MTNKKKPVFDLVAKSDGLWLELDIGEGTNRKQAAIHIDSEIPYVKATLAHVYAHLKYPDSSVKAPGKVHHIHEDGTTVTSIQGETPSLNQLQEMVKGYIQLTQCIWNGQECQMIINEEPWDLNSNLRASRLHHAWAKTRGRRATGIIVGPVVVLENLELS